MLRRLFAPDASAELAAPPSKPSPATAAAPPAPAGGAPAKPAPAPPAAPAAALPAAEESDDPFMAPKKPATAPAATPAAPEPDYDKLAPKELRDRAKQLRTEREQLANKIKSLEALVTANEAKGRDSTSLTSRIEALEQQLSEREGTIRALNQEASPEFKKKWEEPFNRAAKYASKEFNELVITNAETGETRKAVWDSDFREIYFANANKAIELSQKFGAAAGYVLGIREKLKSLDQAKSEALEEERANWKQKNDQDVAERSKEEKTVNELWTQTNKRLADTNPDYRVDPTDAELADVQKHALEVYDNRPKLAPGADRAEFFKKITTFEAHVRQKVAAFPVLKTKLARAEAKNAELQAQIDELKGAAPGATRRPGGSAPAATEDDDAAWEKSLKETVGSA